MYKKIILINGYRTASPTLPAGLGYIAQAIENTGFDYEVCDVNLQTEEQILETIKINNPEYIGLGTMTYEVEKNYQLLIKIRNLMPELKIILGGPHSIAAGIQIFQECNVIDIIIKGEGEESIVKVLQGIPLSNITGVLTRETKEDLIIKSYLNIHNIDFPKYTKFDLEKYGQTMQIASSRGCVYRCSFCGAPRFLGNKWRAFTVERMIEEFEYWYQRGYKRFYFSDSLFALNKQRVIDFCNYIINSEYDDIEFTADGIRADHLTLEILRVLKNARFKSLTIGVESVNDKTLKFFKKGESFGQIDAAIKNADLLGFDITIYLIIGAPTESYYEARRSIYYPLKYKNIICSTVSKLTPIKGTDYYDYAISNKLKFDNSPHYPQMEVYGFSDSKYNGENSIDDIWTSLIPVIRKIDIFISNRKLIKNKLNEFGYNNLSVKSLNIITYIYSLKIISILLFVMLQVYRKIKKHCVKDSN